MNNSETINDILVAKYIESDLDVLIQRVENYRKEGKSIWKDVEVYLKDKTLPINDRWILFVESDHRELDSTTLEGDIDGIDWERTSLYDDFGTDKNATLLAADMLDNHEESIKDIDAFREWWLQSDYKGFINSW